MRLKMKERFFLAAIVVLSLSLGANATLAYFTDEATARNVITTGGVDIEIAEWQETEDGLVPYPGEEVAVMPGETVSKIVTVENLDAESYIRAKAEITVLDAQDEKMELESDELEGIIRLTMNGQDWLRKEGDSEWWYFAHPLTADEATTALFTQVTFDGPSMGNEYQNCTITIDVKAQAVQAANNGTDALTAAGWPKTQN